VWHCSLPQTHTQSCISHALLAPDPSLPFPTTGLASVSADADAVATGHRSVVLAGFPRVRSVTEGADAASPFGVILEVALTDTRFAVVWEELAGAEDGDGRA